MPELADISLKPERGQYQAKSSADDIYFLRGLVASSMWRSSVTTAR